MASAPRIQAVLFISTQPLMLYKHNNHKTYRSKRGDPLVCIKTKAVALRLTKCSWMSRFGHTQKKKKLNKQGGASCLHPCLRLLPPCPNLWEIFFFSTWRLNRCLGNTTDIIGSWETHLFSRFSQPVKKDLFIQEGWIKKKKKAKRIRLWRRLTHPDTQTNLT